MGAGAVFEAHGTAYIVMEYAEGETLSAHLERKGSLSEAELKAILYPLLDGLAVVHGADFLHRDIKPGNIVLRDVDGSPVLLDFGAARQAIGAKSRSVTSIVTPGYAPIEQYSTRGRQGPWTDIYALGGVCYRALTGDLSVFTHTMKERTMITETLLGMAWKGRLDVIKLYVCEGGDVNAAGLEDRRLLHRAAQGGHLDVVQYLVEHGAEVNIRDSLGQTPLHKAAREGHLDVVRCLEVVKYLVGRCADVTARDNYGKTPRDLAAHYGQTDVVEYFDSLAEASAG